MDLKFPCDNCPEGNPENCLIVCDDFENYAKQYPTSLKVKKVLKG